jgi:cytochrome c peroxidase
MKLSTLILSCSAAALLAAAPLAVQAATPAEMLAGYSAKAGVPASAEKGQKFFATNFGRDLGFSCSSCHTTNPAKEGKDQVTEKKIKPLAPAANPLRFTDAHKAEFHFDLNCKDVVGRICTPAEKADVLAWLISLKP